MIDLSICMVSLNCWSVLDDCLKSLSTSYPVIVCEVIIVDNASTDGTSNFIRENYPDVKLVENYHNVGFTKATNQAIELSTGRYIMWLNTDTIVKPDTLYKLVNFLDSNPKVGVVGPKVLNTDGSFQPQCRRGIPTPLSSISYFVGLDKILSKHRWATQYLQSHLPIDQVAQVDAVSGCCLMARREVYSEIGLLDDNIFGFGEDIDWCVRAKKAGWQVWYYPIAIIIFFGDQQPVKFL